MITRILNSMPLLLLLPRRGWRFCLLSFSIEWTAMEGILITQNTMSESIRFILLRWWARKLCPEYSRFCNSSFVFYCLQVSTSYIKIYSLFVTISWFNITQIHLIHSRFYIMNEVSNVLYGLILVIKELFSCCLNYLYNDKKYVKKKERERNLLATDSRHRWSVQMTMKNDN